MRLFTANQVNQVYVVNRVVNTPKDVKNVGDIAIVKGSDNVAYFVHKGAGGITRSDFIPLNNVMWKKFTTADAMREPLNTFKVELDSTYTDNGNPIAGQDYILRIEADNYIGISPEDSKYWKYAAVHATRGMTASNFYKAMALSIAGNMSREAVQFLKVTLTKTGSVTPVEVTPETKASDLSGTFTALNITEVEPDWILGLKQQKVIKLTVTPTTITDETDGEVTWGTVTPSIASYLGNGKLMADYEFFYMKERADNYGLVDYPIYTPTTYLVDPGNTYHTYGVHFAFTGSNESVQKSEKDITLIVDTSLDAYDLAPITSIFNDTAVATAIANYLKRLAQVTPEITSRIGTTNDQGVKVGDINGDGEIDNTDVVALSNYVMGDTEMLSEETLERINKGAGDINNDGVTDISDAVALSAYVMGQ